MSADDVTPAKVGRPRIGATVRTRRSLAIEDASWQGLRAAASAKGVSASELANRILHEWLERLPKR